MDRGFTLHPEWHFPGPTLTFSEAAEKKAAQERYAKLQAAGKTDQAKSDLARLQEIRKRREAAAAQRIAEQEGGLSRTEVF